MALCEVVLEAAQRLERGKRESRVRTQSRAFWSGPRGDRHHGARDVNVTAATQNGAKFSRIGPWTQPLSIYSTLRWFLGKSQSLYRARVEIRTERRMRGAESVEPWPGGLLNQRSGSDIHGSRFSPARKLFWPCSLLRSLQSPMLYWLVNLWYFLILFLNIKYGVAWSLHFRSDTDKFHVLISPMYF